MVTHMINLPTQQKPKPVSFRVKDDKKRQSKTPLSPKSTIFNQSVISSEHVVTGKPEKLPELIVEAPISNATITKNRAQRPQRTHRVTRPSKLPETTSDLVDAPSLSTIEDVSPINSPTKSPPPVMSPIPLSPSKSPSLNKSPSPTKSSSPNKSPSTPSTEIPVVSSE